MPPVDWPAWLELLPNDEPDVLPIVDPRAELLPELLNVPEPNIPLKPPLGRTVPPLD
jgi:hypothetical protein